MAEFRELKNTKATNESMRAMEAGVATGAFVTEARNEALAQSQKVEEELMEEELEEEEAEANYAYHLNSLRSLEGMAGEVEAIKERGDSFGKPSMFKYFCCGSIAMAKDAMEILALAGVVTIPLAWFVGPMISALLILIFWMSNVKAGKAKDFTKGLEKDIEVIQENIAHATRIVNRIPGARGLAKKGATRLAARASRSKTAIKLTEKFAGSPVAKAVWSNVIDSAADISVIFQWLPASTIGVILSYLDERKIYKNAAENATEAYAQLSSQLNESSAD